MPEVKVLDILVFIEELAYGLGLTIDAVDLLSLHDGDDLRGMLTREAPASTFRVLIFPIGTTFATPPERQQ